MLKALGTAFAARGLRLQCTQKVGACSPLFGQCSTRCECMRRCLQTCDACTREEVRPLSLRRIISHGKIIGVSCKPPRHANACSGLKETTGLVGLEVDPEARTNLLAASQQVLEAVAEKIPQEAQYRANVEATMEHWIEKVGTCQRFDCGRQPHLTP